jgi:hypothetical protein
MNSFKELSQYHSPSSASDVYYVFSMDSVCDWKDKEWKDKEWKSYVSVFRFRKGGYQSGWSFLLDGKAIQWSSDGAHSEIPADVKEAAQIYVRARMLSAFL